MFFLTKTTLSHSTRLLAATTLRNVLGTKLLSEILSEREGISKLIKVSNSNYLIIISRSQETLDEATDPWGVRVQMVELKVSMMEVSIIQLGRGGVLGQGKGRG